MKGDQDDVHLTDGTGMMTQDQPYKDHLRLANESKEVRSNRRWTIII